MKGLFEEFESVNKKAWLEKIEADAKGRSVSDHEWKISNDFVQSPFVHREDIDSMGRSILRAASTSSWSIGERIIVVDVDRANKQIIAALENGASTLFISINGWIV